MSNDKTRSLTILRNYLRFALSQIVYHKALLPSTSFVERTFCGVDLFLIDAVDDNGHITCEKGYRISQWLEKGVFPILEKGYLEGFSILLLSSESSAYFTDGEYRHEIKKHRPQPGKVLERFHFEIEEIHSFQDNAEVSLSKQVLNLHRVLIEQCQKTDRPWKNNCSANEINEQRTSAVLSFAIFYSDKTPLGITPDFFSCSNKNHLFKKNDQNSFLARKRAEKHRDTPQSVESHENCSQLHQASIESSLGGTKCRQLHVNNVKHDPLQDAHLGSFETNAHKVSVTYICDTNPIESKLELQLRQAIKSNPFTQGDETSRDEEMESLNELSNIPSALSSPETKSSKGCTKNIPNVLETKSNIEGNPTEVPKDYKHHNKRTPPSILKNKSYTNSTKSNKKLRISPFTPTPKRNRYFETKIKSLAMSSSSSSAGNTQKQQHSSQCNLSRGYSEDPTLVVSTSGLTSGSYVTPPPGPKIL